MFPNRLLLIACLCCLRILLSAQAYTLTLSDKRLDIKDFPYYVVQVTDARAQQYCLGMAKVGLNDRRVPVFSKDSLTTELTGLFKRSLNGDTAGRKPVIVRVNQLFVYEATQATGQVFLEISLSFLQPVDGGYLELATIGATSMKQSGIDASHKHDDNIVAGIEECLLTLQNRAQRGLWNTLLVKEANLYQAPIPTAFPMLQTGPNKAGVYYTFSDFLHNTPYQEPDIPVAMVPSPGKHKGAAYYSLQTKLKFPRDQRIWGVSDGEYAYALVNGAYYRLEQEKDSFFLTIPGPPNADKLTNAALFGGLLGGVIGGFVGGVVAGAIVSGMEGPPVRLQVDLLTSSLSPLDLPNARRVEARVLLFCSEFAKSPITVQLDGQVLCTLEAGTFYRLRVPPPAAAITLMLEANGKTYQEMVQPELFNTEVCLLRLVKGSPKLDLPNGEIRSKLIRQMSSGEMKEQCKE